MDINKILIRSLSGIIYIAIIVVACIFEGYALNILATIFGIFGVIEIRKMRYGDLSSQKLYLIYDSIGITLLAFSSSIWPLAVWVLWLSGRAILAIYSKRESPEKEIAVDVATQVYLGMSVAIIPLFDFFLHGGMLLLSAFIIIWVNDTGAFLFGSMFGRHRLFERISPKKSWEGFWGGFICSIGVGAIFGFTNFSLADFHLQNKAIFWILAGALISVASTYGDLFESMIKRNLHTKDSGNLIPGHGGILDRIDSLLFVVPLFFIFIFIFDFL